MTLRGLALIITGAAALSGAAPALAADVALSGTQRAATWDTAAGRGADPMGLFTCSSPAVTCATQLIHVTDNGGEEPGTLVVSVAGDQTVGHVDLTLYSSDKDGTAGEVLGDTSTIGQLPDAKLVTEGHKGWYLVETVTRLGYGAIHGKAELLGVNQEFSTAAPAKRATLNTAKPSFSWSGSLQGAVFDCGELAPQVQPCDWVLVHITEPGDLGFTASNVARSTPFFYMQLYKSSKAGTKTDDDELGSSSGVASPGASVGAAGLEPGYYLAQIGSLAGAGAYDGTITFTPTPPDDGEDEEEGY